MHDRSQGWNRIFKPIDNESDPYSVISSTSGYNLVSTEAVEAISLTNSNFANPNSEVRVAGQVDTELRTKHENAGFAVPRVQGIKRDNTVLFAPQVRVNHEPFLEGLREQELALPTWVFLTTDRTRMKPEAWMADNNNAGAVSLHVTPEFIQGDQEEVRYMNRMLWLAALAVNRGSGPEVSNRAAKAHRRKVFGKNLLFNAGAVGLAVAGITEAGEALSAMSAYPDHAVHFPLVMQRITEASVPAFAAGVIGDKLIGSESRPLKLGINKVMKQRKSARLAARMAERFKVLEPVL